MVEGLYIYEKMCKNHQNVVFSVDFCLFKPKKQRKTHDHLLRGVIALLFI